MQIENNANLQVEMKRDAEELARRLQALERPLQIADKQRRSAELAVATESPDFWSNPEKAGQIQREKTAMDREVKQFVDAKQKIDDAIELLDLVGDSADDLFALRDDIESIKRIVHQIEMQRMLSGPNDRCNAILSVNVGQGGVDSQDFAEMLLRMYTRYAERRDYTVELVDHQPGEGAGIKSATIFVSGEFAYGYLKAEIGVHRLVRISPFDANARRHTSFASVWVIPEVDDSVDIDIRTEDLRIDTYRAGGAGGQHVNKTESAVRITHLPTNTVVACQSERSQIKNRSTAMKLLKAKLYDLEIKKRLADKDKAEAEKMEASFGSQIRNYVLAPYRLAKDLRTGEEVGNVDAVLDGDIQGFIESYLLSAQK